MATNVFTNETLLKLIDKYDGNKSKVAASLNVTRQTIHRRLKQIQLSSSIIAITDPAHQKHLNDEYISPLDQLGELNDIIWKILDDAVNADEKLAAAKEIKDQLKLCLDIQERLFDVKNIRAFQEAVFEALDETNPEIRREVVRRINAKKEMLGLSIL